MGVNVNVKVSVIIPVYNSVETVEEAVISVFNQTYSDWELIVVDDCSNDGTYELLQSLSAQYDNFFLYKTPINSGPACARNLGLVSCSGRYVSFLDSDDFWYPDKLSTQVRYMEEHSIKLSYCVYNRKVVETGKVYRVASHKYVDMYDMYKRNCIGLSTAMYDFDAFGYMRFKDVPHEDYVFWVDMIKMVGKGCQVPSEDALVVYSVRKSSISGNKLKSAIWHWNNLRRDFGLGFVCALYYYSWYVFLSIKKYI